MSKSYYTVKISELRKIYSVACPAWKDQIAELVEDINCLRVDTVRVHSRMIKEMLGASTPEQRIVVEKVFAEYVADNKDSNPFLSATGETQYLVQDLSEAVFGDRDSLQVAGSASYNIERPDLKNRALYISPLYDVLLHPVSYTSGTVIEFKRRKTK